jgi:hypothetical protein
MMEEMEGVPEMVVLPGGLKGAVSMLVLIM